MNTVQGFDIIVPSEVRLLLRSDWYRRRADALEHLWRVFRDLHAPRRGSAGASSGPTDLARHA